MSYSWTSTGHGFLDDEPQDVHALSCAIWQSPDPADDCDCGSFQAGVHRLVARFESYADRADGAA
jgi:hypothetical protein